MDKIIKDMLIAYKNMPSSIITVTPNHNIITSVFISLVIQYFIIPKEDTIDFLVTGMRDVGTNTRSYDCFLFKDEIDYILANFEFIYKPFKDDESILRAFHEICSNRHMKNDGQYIGKCGLCNVLSNIKFDKNETFNYKTYKGQKRRGKIIETLSVKNKFNVKYDVYYKNGIKYITTYELTNLLLLEPQSTSHVNVRNKNHIPYTAESHNETIDWIDRCGNIRGHYNAELSQKYHSQVMPSDNTLYLFDLLSNISILEMEMEVMILYLRNSGFHQEATDTENIIAESKMYMWLHDTEILTTDNTEKEIRFSNVLKFLKYKRGSLYITGLYEINTKRFCDTQQNNNKLKVFSNIIVTKYPKHYDKQKLKYATLENIMEWDSKNPHRDRITKLKEMKQIPSEYTGDAFNEQRMIYEYESSPEKLSDYEIISDDALVTLFKIPFKKGNQNKKCSKPKKILKKPKTEQTDTLLKKCSKPTEPIDAPSGVCDAPHIDPPTEQTDAPHTNTQITFKYRCEIDSVMRRKIEVLLQQLICDNSYFADLCDKYNRHIHIIKDVYKKYTSVKYINFTFGENNRQYHAYLNKTETTITNITFISNIKV